MGRELMPIEINRLVQTEKGLVSRTVFVDQKIYELELERIFAKCWLYLGHESQIPKPGDFMTTYMGEDPVILWRDSTEKVGAFLNSCRHRGMKVCRLEEGNANFLSCPYHGWTYSNQGKLVTVPEYKEGYLEELDREEWGLIRVAKVETYKGLIFGTFDEGAEPLEEYLGEMRWYLDMMVDRMEGGLEVLPGTHKWTVNANWKFGADNFVGDSYHVLRTHLSIFQLGFVGPPPGEVSMISAGKGHGLGLATFNLEAGKQMVLDDFPKESVAYVQYLWEVREKIENRLGKERAQKLQHLQTIHGTVFPNFSFLNTLSFFTFRVWRPRGPLEMEVRAVCVVDKGMPNDLKETVRRAYLTQFGPGGVLEQDDVEIWSQCTETARGRVCRRYPLTYQMGLGHEKSHKTMPGRFGQMWTEIAQRSFYERWVKLMGRNGRSEGV
jgi:nitrite reductase/ring-hydroxylating ferredoxin subunit